MAPSRGRGKTKIYPLGKSSPARSSRRTRSQRNPNDGVADVYKDLLAEASQNESEDLQSEPPLKRRKVAGSATKQRNIQTIEASSGSSDNSDDSEFDFEYVDLDQPAAKEADDDDIVDVSVAIDSGKLPRRAPVAKQKAATPAEKAHRVLVHKLHVLCLLGHCMYVNTWCNDPEVQRHLRKWLPKKTSSYLKHNPEFSQFQQNRSFMDGLQQASEAWRGAFRITTSGMRRARWTTDPDSEIREAEVDPLDRDEFRRAAKEMEGSQDMGNQLFCALLRAAGVEARVVCSLQVLPFAMTSKDKLSPQKEVKKTVYATASRASTPATEPNTEDLTMANSSTIGKVPSARRRIGQPSLAATPPPPNITPREKQPIRRLTHPVFWTEAFNKAHQTWVPVDPLVTQTIHKAAKLEPPLAYDGNQMSYVLAFESDGVARDVTKRYAKAFNAKTRRLRIESATTDGVVWLKKSLRIFRRPRSDEKGRDRDQIEDAQLAHREAQEGLPTNVQDFKHHPYYALERHLRRHEVLHPRRAVGKVNAGTAAKPRMEEVFRRSDVQGCKSGDKWFREGREVKQGEQPLKRVPARRVRKTRLEIEEDEDERDEMQALYAPYQTELYVPPPVVKGKVPRNGYGNLDIYVPSMVPSGGAHIRHPLAKEAARILKIDAVDTVTGFKFQGRQGTAIVEGVVIPADFRNAVEAVIEGLGDEQREQEGRERSLLALKVWRRFLTGLRIRERVSAYGNGDNEDGEDEEMVEDDEREGGGGLIADETVVSRDGDILPTAGKFSLVELMNAAAAKASKANKRRRLESDESEEAELLDEDSEGGEGGFESQEPARSARRLRNRVLDDESEDEDIPTGHASGQDEVAEESGGGLVAEDGDGGGGFMAEDDDMGGGGFVAEVNDHGVGGFVPEEEGEGGGFIPDICINQGSDGGGFTVDEEDRRPDHEEASSKGNDESNAIEQDGDTIMSEASRPACKADEEQSEPVNQPSTTSTTDQQTETQEQVEWQVHGVAEAQIHQWPTDVDDEEDESDRGSMLSHDPEDEDAEPDWLESD